MFFKDKYERIKRRFNLNHSRDKSRDKSYLENSTAVSGSGSVSPSNCGSVNSKYRDMLYQQMRQQYLDKKGLNVKKKVQVDGIDINKEKERIKFECNILFNIFR